MNCCNQSHSRGFTLVELLLSMLISVMIFTAMGRLLVKTTSLWCEGAGQFHLANQARAARARLLSGGMGSGSGLLSVDAVDQIQVNPQWCWIRYSVAGGPLNEQFTIRGSVSDSDKANRSIFIQKNPGGGSTWLMMGAVRRGSQDIPDVMADSFSAVLTNNMLTLQYTLRLEAAGQTFEYPQIIQAHLVNRVN